MRYSFAGVRRTPRCQFGNCSALLRQKKQMKNEIQVANKLTPPTSQQDWFHVANEGWQCKVIGEEDAEKCPAQTRTECHTVIFNAQFNPPDLSFSSCLNRFPQNVLIWSLDDSIATKTYKSFKSILSFKLL